MEVLHEAYNSGYGFDIWLIDLPEKALLLLFQLQKLFSRHYPVQKMAQDITVALPEHVLSKFLIGGCKVSSRKKFPERSGMIGVRVTDHTIHVKNDSNFFFHTTKLNIGTASIKQTGRFCLGLKAG
jgi:hypothetical protein